MKIIPAILTEHPEDLENKIRETESFTDLAQVDIMDGRFVPSSSILAGDLARVRTRLEIEVHLMVLDPESQVEAFVRAGATRIVFHFEATTDPLSVVRQIKSLNQKAGLALNPETPIDPLVKLAPYLDFVLFLSVNPGFYGSPFIPAVLDKIKDLRSRGIPLEVGVDGGMNSRTIPAARASGADYVCVGSAIFGAKDPREAYLGLVNVAGQVWNGK